MKVCVADRMRKPGKQFYNALLLARNCLRFDDYIVLLWCCSFAVVVPGNNKMTVNLL